MSPMKTVKRSIFNAMSQEGQLRVRLLESLGLWKIIDDAPLPAEIKR